SDAMSDSGRRLEGSASIAETMKMKRLTILPLLFCACGHAHDTAPYGYCHEETQVVGFDDSTMGFTAVEVSAALHAAALPTQIVWDQLSASEQGATISLDIGEVAQAWLVTRSSE